MRRANFAVSTAGNMMGEGQSGDAHEEVAHRLARRVRDIHRRSGKSECAPGRGRLFGRRRRDFVPCNSKRPNPAGAISRRTAQNLQRHESVLVFCRISRGRRWIAQPRRTRGRHDHVVAKRCAQSARQWANLGEAVLKGGAPVIGPGSLEQCWRGSSANRAYSLGWWNNRQAPGGREFDVESMLVPKWQRQSWSGTVLCRNAPNDLVACIGSGYQRLYVIPSMNLVVVRHGNGRKFSDAQFLRLLLGR